MSKEIDDELKDLLDQLDEQDEFLPSEEEIAEAQQELEPEPEPEPEAFEPEVLEPEDDPVVSLAVTGDEKVARPIDEVSEIADQHRFDGNHQFSEVVVEEEVAEANKYLDKMDEVSEEVLQACQADRQEAQDVINMLRKQCEDAHSNQRIPARMYVDGLVKAVEVKANINGNAVKVMEGVAKMIAATKASTNIQNNNMNVSNAELDEILSKPAPMPGGDLD
jgi:hypothetical protein